ncbi:hypothetical protein E4T50_09800 [Aureobasidium sp. EXF-12298]|nr:hypothetical protein E4T50_09800 [Aureobasidium sp. EXF-12298]
MATQADIDALTEKISTTGPLSWVVTDCPVVAVFKNSQTQDLDSLGQPLDRNGCGDLLRLWLGMNQDTRELFVTLTIRIRVSPVRKKTRRQGRLISLRLTSSAISYSHLDQVLSQHLFDVPSDIQSAKCELLKMSIDLGPYTSDVIMPEYQCRSNVVPQAMVLLQKLKSLSEASSFQLYTNQETSREAAIQHVSNILLEGSSMITPSVDIRGFYPGGRSACKNMWLDHGWLAAGHKDVPAKGNTVEMNQTESHSLSKPQPPPPYNAVPGYALAPTSPGEDELLSLPPTIAPVSPHGLLSLPATALRTRSASARSASHIQHQQLCEKETEVVPVQILNSSARVRHLSPSTPEASLSSGYTATFLSGFPSHSPIHRIRDNLMAQAKGVPTESGRAFVQVAASSIDDHASHNGNSSTRANTPCALGRVPDSTDRKRLLSHSLQEESNQISKRQALFQQQSQTLFVNGLRADFSPTVPNTITCYDEDKFGTPMQDGHSFERRSQLSEWLFQAWHHCPTAHYLFITELLSYGAALSRSSSEDEIATCRIDCTLALLAHCTEQRRTEKSDRCSTDCMTDVETRALVKWLYILRPGADMDLFTSLTQLSLLSQQSLSISRTGKDYTSLVAKFRRQKAEVVSQACISYGAALLQNDSSDLATRMLREERSEI